MPGVRATAGEKTGFAYSDELTKRDLELAAGTARYIAQSPQGDRPVPFAHRARPQRELYPVTKEQAAEMRPITVERTRGDQTIIASGVVAGETVVTDGQLRLTPRFPAGRPGLSARRFAKESRACNCRLPTAAPAHGGSANGSRRSCR